MTQSQRYNKMRFSQPPENSYLIRSQSLEKMAANQNQTLHQRYGVRKIAREPVALSTDKLKLSHKPVDTEGIYVDSSLKTGSALNQTQNQKANFLSTIETGAPVGSRDQGQSSKFDPLKGYDHLFKIILLGRASSGKTSLLIRFVDGKYDSKGQLNTIGMDLKSVTLQVEDEAVRLQIWDTQGQE